VSPVAVEYEEDVLDGLAGDGVGESGELEGGMLPTYEHGGSETISVSIGASFRSAREACA
jgi:hypothetical protein